MASFVKFNQKKFNDVFSGLLMGIEGMNEAMQGIGDPRDACMVEAMKVFETYIKDILTAVDNGKKILFHCGIISPEIFLAFENVQPYAMEIPFVIHSFLDPEHANEFIDIAEGLGMPPDVCCLDKGFLGFTLKEVNPPAAFVVTPTTPCDSLIVGHQILERLIDAPFAHLEIPYWQDQRAVDLFSHHIWKTIKAIEEVCHTKMDWDKCRENILLANEVTENFMEENEMRKLIPCPHSGKIGSIQQILNYAAAGTVGARDASKFIIEDSKKLAAKKQGALANERARTMWYYPDPLHDLGLHDWLEDEYNTITVMTMFGHATQTLIDPSTPESIVKGWAWKMMNTAMTRQLRGTAESYLDDMISVMKGWSIDGAVIPLVIPCKHGQALFGFVRDACRELNMPVMFAEYDPLDPRPVTAEELRNKVAEFLETQVLPLK
jgi:benzoyl-CoA reductase/2-hydroxyglutaryl-CoA dehydratase subunit BcrC/BadD/HgdB